MMLPGNGLSDCKVIASTHSAQNGGPVIVIHTKNDRQRC